MHVFSVFKDPVRVIKELAYNKKNALFNGAGQSKNGP